MKIVHVEDVFHPDTGYQLNLLSKYMADLGHDVVIITAETEKLPDGFMGFFGSDHIEERDKEFSDKYKVRIRRIPTFGYYSGRVFLKREYLDIIKDENPDVVFMHGNDTVTAMRYLLNIKKMDFPLVLDSHMLDMASKNKFKYIFRWCYKKIITPIITKNNIPVIRTQDSEYVQEALGIPLEQAPWISTGSDTMLFKKNESVFRSKREEMGIPEDAFVVTYAGKLDEAKGGLLLANAIKEKIDIGPRKLYFVIIGNAVGDYGEKVNDVFNASENAIIRFSTQKYVDLATFFQMTNLVVFPKQCSLTFYDAQACGVPVVFENNEINSKRVKDNNALIFESGNISDFRAKIKTVACMHSSEYEHMCEASQKFVLDSYDYKDICKQYMDVIEKEISRFNSRRNL